VAILHSGNHEVEEIPPEVEHIHTDAYDEACLRQVLEHRQFDVCYAMYGRLRVIAQLMASRCTRFISVGGAPAYKGYMNPFLFSPEGLPVPTREDAELVSDASQDEKGYRIVRTEQRVLVAIPGATHFRYPYIYGPSQAIPREWLFVRRILDGRKTLILPDGGLTLHSYGYAGNVAHALLLALDKPEASAGKVYNVADDQLLSLRQVAETVADALGHRWDIVNLPYELAPCTRPFVMQPLSTHRVQDTAALRRDLGYRDQLTPREALASTARWLRDNPPQPGGWEEVVLQDPFDYQAEDQLLAAWQQLVTAMPTVEFKSEPQFTMSYSGPGGRPRSKSEFED
jgi:nucleoside-diphosphate-sugar epimerase